MAAVSGAIYDEISLFYWCAVNSILVTVMLYAVLIICVTLQFTTVFMLHINATFQHKQFAPSYSLQVCSSYCTCTWTLSVLLQFYRPVLPSSSIVGKSYFYNYVTACVGYQYSDEPLHFSTQTVCPKLSLYVAHTVHEPFPFCFYSPVLPSSTNVRKSYFYYVTACGYYYSDEPLNVSWARTL